ncbi:MAG: hypothetical protein ACWGNV_12530, partial [Bacteroidales bacterium]
RSGGPEHALSLHIGYVQIKDQFNYGLSFGGLNLSGNYELRYGTDKLDLGYGAALEIGAVHNKGVGLVFRLRPVDGFAGFRLISDAERKLSLGPYLSSYYMWQLYPELQSGHLFWYSSYELGPRLRAAFSLKSWEMKIAASMAFLSLNSRPEYTTERYYYSSTFSDFVKKPHSNMKAGYPGAVNHIELFLAMDRPGRKMAFGYQFEYVGYRDTPTFQYLTHSIFLEWKIASQKK